MIAPQLLFEDRDLDIMVLQMRQGNRLLVRGAWSAKIIDLAEKYQIQELVFGTSSSMESLLPVSRLKKLRHLYIGCDNIRDLSVLKEMRNLRELTLYAVRNTEVISFASLENLRRCKILLNEGRANILAQTSLRRLDIIAYNKLSLDLSKLINLKWLRMESCVNTAKITIDTQLLGFWVEQCPRLSKVQSSDTLKNLLWLHIKNRTKLDFGNCDLSSLEYLLLSGVGDVRWLSALTRSERLTYVHLTGNSAAEIADVKRLGNLPNLKVLTYEKGPQSLWKAEGNLPMKLG